MSKAIDVPLSKLHFPASCVVCMSPVTKEFKLQRVFSYGRGRRTFRVQINLPMCDNHFEAANYKSPAEKLAGGLGVVMAIVTGLSVFISLLRYWASTGQGNIILNLFSGGVMGIGVFLIGWVITVTGITPLFAAPESKEARSAVRIKKYWPRDAYVRLEFANDNLADMVASKSQG